MTGGSARARASLRYRFVRIGGLWKGIGVEGHVVMRQKKTRARWTLVTASAKPGNIGTSFEISFILSLPYEIVKRFAEVGPGAGLRGCSSFFCIFWTKRKAQGEHLTNSLPCARSAMAPRRGLTNEAHPNGSGRSLSRSIIF